MKKKRRGNVITMFAILFVVFSFLVPEILLSMQEKQLEEKVFTREKKESKLDVEAEKIYLVRAIHEIEEVSNLIAIEKWHEVYTTSKGQKEDFKLTEVGKQMEKLEEFQILQGTGIDIPSNYSVYSNTTGYRNNQKEYLLGNVQVEIEGNKYELVMESKTGKILTIVLPKEKICEERTKQEILESFLHYLDLYIIDDWEYKEENLQSQKYHGWNYLLARMKSEKADLVIMLYENDMYYMLGIRSQNSIYESIVTSDLQYQMEISPAN